MFTHTPGRVLCRCALAVAAALVMFSSIVPTFAQTKQKKADAAAKGDAAQQPAEPPKPAVVLPLGRTSYITGEKVPVAVSNAPAKTRLTMTNDVTVYLVGDADAPAVIDTQWLAPGKYSFAIGDTKTDTMITLASAWRRSAASISDESALQGDPQLTDQERKDPALRRAAVEKHLESLRQTMRETGVNAMMEPGVAEVGRMGILDAILPVGTVAFPNPYTRPMSFNPARVYEQEMNAFRQRLALGAQANLRYPNFGGYYYEWDPADFLGRKGLLVYWSWGKNEQPLRNYLARADQAVFDDFKRRTGMEPVTTQEYIAYTAAIHRPDFAPVFDLPTVRWVQKMAAAAPAQKPEEIAVFEKRLDAWSNYLMGLYKEGHDSYQSLLKSIDPTLSSTGSNNLDHNTVNKGQYTPSAYEGLDFRYMTSWNDQAAGPDYIHQWLLSAAMMNTNRNGEPIWVGTSMGFVHNQSETPGKLVRVIAHNLPQGGSGTGFAFEGFSTVVGSMNGESLWKNFKGNQDRAAEILAGRDFIERFSSLAVNGKGDYGVAVLFSRSQLARQHMAQGFLMPHWRAVVALTRLGYTPKVVTEEEITADRLKNYKALIVLGQTFPTPSSVTSKIESFSAAGGLLLVDRSTTVKWQGAKVMDCTLPVWDSGRAFNWGVANSTGPHIELAERSHAEFAPALLAALGDTGRGVFRAENGATSRVSPSQIDAGRDAKFVVAVNDSCIRTQGDWVQVKERLVPVGAPLPDAVVYDLNREALVGKVGPMDCDLTRTTARVFGVLARPVASTRLRATQDARPGEDLVVSVEFLDASGKPLEAALPFWIAIRTDGGLALEGYRSTNRDGWFTLAVRLPLNQGPRATVTVRSQLDGQVTELSITIGKDNMKQRVASPINDKVTSRGTANIEALLKTPGSSVVIPVFDGPSAEQIAPVAELAAKILAKRGVKATVLKSPPMTTYTMAYDPTPAELAENTRAEKGEAIGKNKLTTANRNDYFGAGGGYTFGSNVLLLDIASQKDNPLAEHLASAGFLWPEVSEAFPGRGGAVVQCLRRTLSPTHDTIVVQAGDIEGLKAGVESLASPPVDWIGASVSAARSAMLREWHIGGAPDAPKLPPESAARLTDKGATKRSEPKPFEIAFKNAPPTDEEARQRIEASKTKPSEAAKEDLKKPVATPGTLDFKRFTPLLNTARGYEPTWSPGGPWLGDMRFSDAIEIKLDAAEAGRVVMHADGVFRYSDRTPCMQGSWEDLWAAYSKIILVKREKMSIDVMINDKVIGTLATEAVAKRRVEVRMGTSGSKPETAEEDAVIRLTGEVTLPKGESTIRLVQRNIVDGKLHAVHVGVDAPLPVVEEKK